MVLSGGAAPNGHSPLAGGSRSGSVCGGWAGRVRTRGAGATWDHFENLSGPRGSDGIRRARYANHEVVATEGRGPVALTPALSPASTRVLLPGYRFAGEGARARRGRGLAANLIHQPPRGGWGLGGWRELP